MNIFRDIDVSVGMCILSVIKIHKHSVNISGIELVLNYDPVCFLEMGIVYGLSRGLYIATCTLLPYFNLTVIFVTEIKDRKFELQMLD